MSDTLESWEAVELGQTVEYKGKWYVQNKKTGKAVTDWGQVTQSFEVAHLLAAAPVMLAACKAALPILQEFAEEYEPPTDWQYIWVTPEQEQQIDDWARLRASADIVAAAIAQAEAVQPVLL